MMALRYLLAVAVVAIPSFLALSEAQTPPPGEKLQLRISLVLTPEFCASKAKSIGGPVAVGKVACDELEPALKEVFSEVARMTAIPSAADTPDLVLVPSFASSRMTNSGLHHEQIDLVLNWTARDGSGKIVWASSVTGSGTANKAFTRNKNNFWRLTGEDAAKDAVRQSARQMAASPEFRGLVRGPGR
jgi:hypothetical protein